MAEQEPMWVRVADALFFIEDTAAVAQIASRFEAGYLPAITGARSDAARERAIDALMRYLETGYTPRKKWALEPGQVKPALDALVTLADSTV
ncbi:MAG: hypothetical protein O3B65_03370 [Chloroflexi bacterium]|nr:hypothetical protein [Chloroflexota bacterium]